MKYSLAIVTGAVLAVAAASVSLPIAANETGDETVRPVISVKLPNVPGKSLSAALVTYPPGGKSGNITTPAVCSRSLYLERSGQKTQRRDLSKSTKPAKHSSSLRAASIL